MSEPFDPSNGHLSRDEIAAAMTPEQSGLAPERMRHAESCGLCRDLLAMHEDENVRIRKLLGGPTGTTDPGPACPDSQELAMLAAGLVSARDSERLLAHVSGCDSCGATLRAAAEDFSADSQPEEASVVQSLPSASPFVQRRMAKAMAASMPSAPRVEGGRWLAYAATLILCLGGGWWGYTQWSAGQPEQLIAAAYGEQRPFEFRIPGGAHGPVRVERGAGRSSFSRPRGLLRAVERIGAELKKTPDDSKWLRLRARAEMLEWDADAAVSTLARATDNNPDDPAVLADLGLAHALRAEAADRSVDYGYAIEYLSRALKARPDYKEALFNRAIVYERMFVYDEALKDWERYLTLDPSGPWADEAQRHKAEIEKKKAARAEALGKITDDPSQLLARLDRGEAVEPEPYRPIAIQWLARSGERTTRQALRELGRMFETRHQDRWLTDTLTASETSTEGLTVLAAVAVANRSDQPSIAIAKGAEAAHRLRSAGNRAGAMQAEAERVYAIHRTFRKAEECVRRAAALEREAASAGYRWIEGQAAIELGVCRDILGDSGSAYIDAGRALATAQSANYPVLALRAAGILAGSQTIAGDVVTIWNSTREALSRFWSGPYPGVRAQQLYVVLRRASEGMDLPNASRAFNAAQVAAVSGPGNKVIEAMGWVKAASLSVATGYPDDAKLEYDRAREIFSKLGPSPTIEEYRMRAEIDRADVDTGTGNPAAALDRLERLRETVLRMESLRVHSLFHQAAGKAYLRDGRWRQAEEEFRASIESTARRLTSLAAPSDRSAAAMAAGDSFRGIAEIQWVHRADPAGAFAAFERFRSAGEEEVPMPAAFAKETFVAWADLSGGVAVWVFDDRGLVSKRLAARPAEVAEAARRLTRLCADPSSAREELNRESRRLYEWLLAPIAASLDPARTLVLIPDASEAAVVFPALIDEQGRYVSDRFATVVASSVSDYGRRVRSLDGDGKGRSLVVANPALGAGATRSFPPLVQAEREGRSVVARLKRATLLEGPRATVAELASEIRDARLLHFAGHGISNAGNGGLVFAPPPGSALPYEVLGGPRLAAQDWSRCRLVVLSACSAGVGESTGPVNPESLVRQLLWAGVSRVVAGRWNVDAESGLVFMDRFYSAGTFPDDVPEALRLAACAVRGNPAAAHPYFWAGFQTFGAR
ncbi:MAG: CHAT domain-containing tetratricopeptide repeat protein [Bryobacteraceae bacterium]